MARWKLDDPADEGFVEWTTGEPVKLSRLGVQPDLDTLWGLLRSLDFRVCGSALANLQWVRDPALRSRPTSGFSNAHWAHGWMCAFKGEGHDSLVSRRWLERGPWKLLRDEALDLSVVLFHDPDERDPAVTWAQAQPAHTRMGSGDRGGFIREGRGPNGSFAAVGGYRLRSALRGVYVPVERTFWITVVDRQISEREMLDACAHRLHGRDHPDKPVDHVAFVFADEAVARAHMHALWLRDLQCWTVRNGEQVRLDTDYRPAPPQRPAWVAAWEARQARRGAGTPSAAVRSWGYAATSLWGKLGSP